MRSAERLESWLERSLDRLAPLRTGGDPQADDWRLRLLSVLLVVGPFVAIAGAFTTALAGMYGSSALSALTGLYWLALIPLFRANRSPGWIGHLFTAGVAFDLVAHNLLVWDQPVALAFLCFVPVSATLVVGRRGAWVWGAVSSLGVWPLAFFDPMGLRTGSTEEQLAVGWLAFSFTLVLTIVLLLTESLRNRAVLALSQANQRASQQQHRFHSLGEATFEMICETDPQGRIVYANDRWRRLGWDPVGLIGLGPEDLMYPEDRDRAALAFTAETPHRVELRLRDPEGEYRWHEAVATQYPADSGERHWLVALRDITDERAERDRLLEAEKMESLGVLAGGIAHDFNNLLTVIAGYAERLPDGEAASEIGTATSRAAELTEKLLAFGRKQVLRSEIVDLNTLVLDSERLIRSLVRESVEVRLELAEDLWRVEVDPGQIQRAIFNLATNARDAMPDGGYLALETRNHRLDDEQATLLGMAPGDAVQLIVRDDGRGMDAVTREHALEPFFTTKDVGRGTGLGLATVHGIVDQSRGAIALESAEGRGTTIRIHLPRSLAAPPEVRPRRESGGGAGRGERILVVEDQPSVRRLISSSLRRAGYEVDEAEGPLEALALAEGTHFDLLVSDVIMPEMRGPALALRLRQLDPDLEVLFVSGYDDQELQEEEAAAGAFLQKPFRPNTLVSRVRGLLDERTSKSIPDA